MNVPLLDLRAQYLSIKPQIDAAIATGHVDANNLFVTGGSGGGVLTAWITGKTIRWVTIRLMLEAGYADGFRTVHPSGDGNTFPTWDPQVRLDYAFVPDAFKQQVKRCDVVRDAAARDASDHFPLLSEINIDDTH